MEMVPGDVAGRGHQGAAPSPPSASAPATTATARCWSGRTPSACAPAGWPASSSSTPTCTASCSTPPALRRRRRGRHLPRPRAHLLTVVRGPRYRRHAGSDASRRCRAAGPTMTRAHEPTSAGRRRLARRRAEFAPCGVLVGCHASTVRHALAASRWHVPGSRASPVALQGDGHAAYSTERSRRHRPPRRRGDGRRGTKFDARDGRSLRMSRPLLATASRSPAWPLVTRRAARRLGVTVPLEQAPAAGRQLSGRRVDEVDAPRTASPSSPVRPTSEASVWTGCSRGAMLRSHRRAVPSSSHSPSAPALRREGGRPAP